MEVCDIGSESRRGLSPIGLGETRYRCHSDGRSSKTGLPGGNRVGIGVAPGQRCKTVVIVEVDPTTAAPEEGRAQIEKGD